MHLLLRAAGKLRQFRGDAAVIPCHPLRASKIPLDKAL
jgi:hypothetical protein